jgi:hypothetical protein
MTHINWNYPPPRDGLAGQWDRFIGPGATRAENTLILVTAIGAAAAVLAYGLSDRVEWTPVQLVVAVILALDLGGGVVANATSAAKRWYHRTEQNTQTHLMFLAAHVVHVLVVMLFFRPVDWLYPVVIFSYLMLVGVLILHIPLYLQRPVALLATLVGILIGITLFTPTPGLEWFLPTYFIKLIGAHLVREEPYQPEEVTHL